MSMSREGNKIKSNLKIMEIEKAEQLARELMTLHGISEKYKLSFSKRLKSTFGWCDYGE